MLTTREVTDWPLAKKKTGGGDELEILRPILALRFKACKHS